MKIVSYDERHLPGLDELWRNCFPDDPPRNRADVAIPAKLALGKTLGQELILVALDSDEEVTGSVMAGYDGHRGWLYAVAVAPAARREGIGAKLVEQACAQLRQLGCRKVNLQIRAGNEEVATFYRSLGFEVEPRTSMGRKL